MRVTNNFVGIATKRPRWLDKERLLSGENLKAIISAEIQKSRFFITLLSRNSVNKRGYVQKELKEAIEILEQLPANDVFIILVRLDDYVILQWAQGFGKTLRCFQRSRGGVQYGLV